MDKNKQISLTREYKAGFKNGVELRGEVGKKQALKEIREKLEMCRGDEDIAPAIFIYWLGSLQGVRSPDGRAEYYLNREIMFSPGYKE